MLGAPYERVFFDCDSTLCRIEGFDTLAERSGQGAELIPITRAAMNGDVNFADAYRQRLELLQPDRDAVEWLAGQYRQQLTAGAEQLVRTLQQAGKQVHIVSGGLLQALMLLAAPLGIPVSHIHGVSLLLNSDGSYAGFDRDSPLCQQNGKAVLCRQLLGADERAVFVGDGVTDLEVAGTGIDFIGYGGVVRRPAVATAAETYYEQENIVNLLTLLLDERECASINTEPV
ncbi:phosphoserine phosphatase [Methylohalomonas lacus]|uniref:phosphoserine phosphatase n=1 Tax=Methylohalomonas lacus TaxID=398773 RepID=A0AAE3HM51_9GAMM|nr:HAD-IB family phosphatase [Methylohalomonas lacus]MCS3903674.1 phosphoserine phosphatase [Methylohalomonas lacus]